MDMRFLVSIVVLNVQDLQTAEILSSTQRVEN